MLFISSNFLLNENSTRTVVQSAFEKFDSHSH